MALVCPECLTDACCHFVPKQPDPYIKTSADMTPAKFGHLNHLVDIICCISDSVAALTAGSVQAIVYCGEELPEVDGVVTIPAIAVEPVLATEALTGDGCELTPLSVCIDGTTITKDINGCLQALGAVAPVIGSFFGMTAGGGNPGATDYAATIANAGAGEGATIAAGSGINFPRVSVQTALGIVINNPGAAQTNNTEFKVTTPGTYQLSFVGSVDEPTKVDLFLGSAAGQAPGGTFAPYSPLGVGTPFRTGRAAGTTQITTTGYFITTVANQIVQLRFVGTVGGANTITPLPGGTVRAQSMSLSIVRVA